MFTRTTNLRSLLFATAIAVIAATNVVIDTVVTAATSFRAWVVDHFFTAARLAPTKAGEVAKAPEQILRVAKSYVARLIRRERPRIESAWRMCPST